MRTTTILAAIATALALGSPAGAEELTEEETFVYINCGRCHVVSPKRRMGGIGSTPSFMVIRTWEDWEDRMKSFWTLNPHPAFTQIEGVTEPFPPDRPSPIHPIELTVEEVERILSYARTVQPADLGEAVDVQ